VITGEKLIPRTAVVGIVEFRGTGFFKTMHGGAYSGKGGSFAV
jgi:hypothetical protein